MNAQTDLKEIPAHLYQPPPVSCPACGCTATSQKYNKDGTATYRCNFVEEHGVYCFKVVPFSGYFKESDFVYKGPIPEDIRKKISLANTAAEIKKQLKEMAPSPQPKAPNPKHLGNSKKITGAIVIEDAWSLCTHDPCDLFGCKKEDLIAFGMYFMTVQLTVAEVRGELDRLVVMVAAANGKPCKTVSDDDGFSLTTGDQHIGEVMFNGSKSLIKKLGYPPGLSVKISKGSENTVWAHIGEYGELTLKYIGRFDIGEPSGVQRGGVVTYDVKLRR